MRVGRRLRSPRNPAPNGAPCPRLHLSLSLSLSLSLLSLSLSLSQPTLGVDHHRHAGGLGVAHVGGVHGPGEGAAAGQLRAGAGEVSAGEALQVSPAAGGQGGGAGHQAPEEPFNQTESHAAGGVGCSGKRGWGSAGGQHAVPAAARLAGGAGGHCPGRHDSGKGASRGACAALTSSLCM